MDLDRLIELGLYDPDAVDAEERLELLEGLDRFGLSPERLMAIDDELGLTFVPVFTALEPAGRTLVEVAAELSIAPEELERYLRTAGLPEVDRSAKAFTGEDVAMFRTWRALGDVIGLELGEQLLRTAGASCARLAESGIATFVEVTGRDDIDTGNTDLERVHFNEVAMASYFESADTFTALLRHHMRAAVRRWNVAADESTDRRVRFFVGFVDLVGYTPLSQELSTAELAQLFDHFETVALNATAAHNGRIVKHIGDEVMFVATTAEAALDIALTMIEEFRQDAAKTTPCGGVAVGDLLGREGDFYGPAVNLASRMADLAVPEEVLVSEEVRTAARSGPGGFGFESAGRRVLKGFADPVQLWAARRD
ncbi:MAG: adenylate/guanylate cyclase domain-containing protein [Acidimicrobiales bacterium]